MNESTLTLGALQLGTVPRVAAPFRDDATAAELAEAAGLGLDIVELRIDQFAEPTATKVVEMARHCRALATIATIRSREEGGAWSEGDAARLKLFEAVLGEVDAVDVELNSEGLVDAVVQNAHAAGKRVIVSYHDFDGVPEERRLNDIWQAAKDKDADIVKIAATPNTPCGLRRLAAFTATRTDIPGIVIGMGPLGALSRIFFPALGSVVTFAHFGRESAPGQLDYRGTAELLATFYPAYKAAKTEALSALGLS